MRKLAVALAVFSLAVFAQDQSLTVTGTLHRAMAIGAESTGWSIQLDSPVSIHGKQLESIEVSAKDNARLEQLKEQRVRATGTLSHRQGVETGSRPVLELASIRRLKGSQSDSAKLTGTEWVLEDLGGNGVIDNAQATLSFLENGRVSGRGSCNRFSGTAHITGDTIKIGPLISTRMACAEAVMNQEAEYLKALESAERLERNGSSLLIYSKEFEKPLRFTEETPEH